MPADPASPILRTAFKVGDRAAVPERNRILGPAGEIHLEPRVMDVLCVLAAQPGEVMSRESLVGAVWAVQFGGDESLTRAVSILRKALGADAIETIAKRGYRLARPVDPHVVEASPRPAPVAARQSGAGQSHALRLKGRGPNRVFPVASLDFWRLPPLAFAIALALALGIAAIDASL